MPEATKLASPARRRLLLGLAASLLSPAWAGAAHQPRVVTLFQGATDTAVALGVTPVGIVESWQDKPVYPYLRPDLAGVPLLGLETQPSLEHIVQLEPDIIVASRFRHARIEPLLARIGRVVMLEDIYRFRETLSVMAQVLGREAQAEAWLARLDARIRNLGTRLQKHFDDRWPLTVSLLDIRANEVRSYLPPSFGGSILAALGFRWNAASRRASGVSLKLSGVESLPTVDADVFFVMLHSRSAAVAAHYRRLQAHPLWQRMAAPTQNRVWPVEAVPWVLSGGVLGVMHMLDDVEHWLAHESGRA
ncbi:ABC transporter substrate-binding protein [Salinisphaera dokdonensis]|uniref:ABC transporter substrate-binding protein n=1 Tax=Salinisphaera dokdonensis TaxID=454598 RepID=UPI003DA710B6